MKASQSRPQLVLSMRVLIIRRIRKEIAIFKKVNHPNVVKLREIIDDPDQSKIFMVMEYCEGGEVFWRNGNGRPALTLSEVRRIFRETLLGLEYCECVRIIVTLTHTFV
jgi:serine/threonine protein kinase